MRFLLFLLLTIAVFACGDKQNHSIEVLFFDESEYRLVDSIMDNAGNKYGELYLNKKTPTKEMKKFFWENGKQQSVVYLSNGKKEGPSMLFDETGKLIYEGFYFKDKEMGITIQYDSYDKKAIIKTYDNQGLLNQQKID